ncbi:hypothetical protein EXIGLDRAFT_834345 [Exidia glandulosa HHB12029]|uniref:Protein CPL1-like domain-containing protein n=1 Tax=Exidia glandulosa HHB12029 TaxID=1314781 RepID=A0A165JWH0_EXIGL|nr:hypothetical protein EXIGLDRAFT_834345 [Exidia glandulosa HHB12029]
MRDGRSWTQDGDCAYGRERRLRDWIDWRVSDNSNFALEAQGAGTYLEFEPVSCQNRLGRRNSLGSGKHALCTVDLDVVRPSTLTYPTTSTSAYKRWQPRQYPIARARWGRFREWIGLRATRTRPSFLGATQATTLDAATIAIPRSGIFKCASPPLARRIPSCARCDWERLDVREDVESCGRRTLLSSTLAGEHHPSGVDCAAAEGVLDVAYLLGRCAVSRGGKKFKLYVDGKTCGKISSITTAAVDVPRVSNWKHHRLSTYADSDGEALVASSTALSTLQVVGAAVHNSLKVTDTTPSLLSRVATHQPVHAFLSTSLCSEQMPSVRVVASLTFKTLALTCGAMYIEDPSRINTQTELAARHFVQTSVINGCCG